MVVGRYNYSAIGNINSNLSKISMPHSIPKTHSIPFHNPIPQFHSIPFHTLHDAGDIRVHLHKDVYHFIMVLLTVTNYILVN